MKRIIMMSMYVLILAFPCYAYGQGEFSCSFTVSLPQGCIDVGGVNVCGPFKVQDIEIVEESTADTGIMLIWRQQLGHDRIDCTRLSVLVRAERREHQCIVSSGEPSCDSFPYCQSERQPFRLLGLLSCKWRPERTRRSSLSRPLPEQGFRICRVQETHLHHIRIQGL